MCYISKYNSMPSRILVTATDANINPITRLIILAPLLPISLNSLPAKNKITCRYKLMNYYYERHQCSNNKCSYHQNKKQDGHDCRKRNGIVNYVIFHSYFEMQ